MGDDAENAKIEALAAAENAKTAADIKGYNGFMADANLKIEAARAASEAATIQAAAAKDAGDAGDDGATSDKAAASATAALTSYEEAKVALEGIEAPATTTTLKPDSPATATCIKLSTISVISATLLYSL